MDEPNKVSNTNTKLEFGYDKAGWLSRLTLHWIQPLLTLGKQRPLKQDDLPDLPQRLTSNFTGLKLSHHWQQECNKKKPSLLRALIKTYALEYFVKCMPIVLYATGYLILPYVIKAIMRYVEDRDQYMLDPFLGITSGYALAFLQGAIGVSITLAISQGFLHVIFVGSTVRSGLMRLIGHKGMQLREGSLHEIAGGAENLMSSDTERVFASLLSIVTVMYSDMIMIIVVIISLILEVGAIPALSGIAVMVLTVPIQIQITKILGRIKRKMLRWTDERVQFTKQVLKGIETVKTSSWETRMEQKIAGFRKTEMKMNQHVLYLLATNVFLVATVPSIVTLVIFATFVSLGSTFTLSKAVLVLVYVGILRMPLTLIPKALGDGVQALVSIQRIQAFLLLPTHTKPYTINAMCNTGNESSKSVQQKDNQTIEAKLISFQNVSVSWPVAEDENHTIQSMDSEESSTGSTVDNADDDSGPVADVTVSKTIKDSKRLKNASSSTLFNRNVLSDISFEVKPGELLGIVGEVGAGKSTLVTTILGELTPNTGTVQLPQGRISYVGQDPWIRNSTLRENIVFQSSLSSEFSHVDEELLNKVIEATQLEPDIAVLSHGVETEIGERGVNLSGGQKARVTIARAAYLALRLGISTVVLDDPFSALDPHVGQQVFDRVLTDLLSHCTRIVVLNSHLHTLHEMDKLLVLENGEMVGFGTPNDILRLPRCQWLDQHPSSDDEAVDGADDVNENLGLISTSSIDQQDGSKSRSEKEADGETGLESSEVDVVETKKGKPGEVAGALYKKERRSLGAVDRLVYVQWVAAAVGDSGFRKYINIALVLGLFIMAQSMKAGGQFFLASWSNNPTLYSPTTYSLIYLGFVLGLCLLQILGSIQFLFLANRSSKKMHDNLLRKILNAPLNLYFDIVPTGRILNRFSNDLQKVDQLLPHTTLMLSEKLLQVLTLFGIVLATSWGVVIVVIPICGLFFYIGRYYAKSSRELKRLDSISRSPIFSLFGEVIQGRCTIRALGLDTHFMRLMELLIDANTKAFVCGRLIGRWLSVRMAVGVVIQVAIAVFAVATVGTVPPELVGLALIYSSQFIGMLGVLVRQLVNVESQFTSVERLLQMQEIPQEQQTISNESQLSDAKGLTDHNDAAVVVPWSPEMESTWLKSASSITFCNVSMRYRAHLPLVLRNVSMHIESNSRVGIVGRTGSGKSSMMSLLLRLVDPPTTGYIVMDGVATVNVPLRLLRSRISVIPQCPTLFSGSLRFNLDPVGLCSDLELWSALEKVGLKELFCSNFESLGESIDLSRTALDYVVDDNGSNLSVGQRQLLCIARALLENNKLVLMDEATANIDRATDQLIQDVFKTNFNDCTTLTIAHRLNTIIDSDTIIVLDQGELKEFGSPQDLAKQSGIFAGMLEASDVNMDALNE